MTTSFALAALVPANLLVGVLGLVVVFAVLVVLSIALRALRPRDAAPVEVAAVPQAPAPVAVAPAPDVKLINVEEKEAAMIMAIVCDELQTPPEELYFRSIRRVDAGAQ